MYHLSLEFINLYRVFEKQGDAFIKQLKGYLSESTNNKEVYEYYKEIFNSIALKMHTPLHIRFIRACLFFYLFCHIDDSFYLNKEGKFIAKFSKAIL